MLSASAAEPELTEVYHYMDANTENICSTILKVILPLTAMIGLIYLAALMIEAKEFTYVYLFVIAISAAAGIAIDAQTVVNGLKNLLPGMK